MLAADTTSDLIKLLIGGGVGSLLSKPLEWGSTEKTDASLLSITRLQLVRTNDLSRLNTRLNPANNAARLHMQATDAEGVFRTVG